MFGVSLECVRLNSHLNAFSFSFERVWLHVRTHLASHLNVFGHSNAFGFSFDRVSYNA